MTMSIKSKKHVKKKKEICWCGVYLHLMCIWTHIWFMVWQNFLQFCYKGLAEIFICLKWLFFSVCSGNCGLCGVICQPAEEHLWFCCSEGPSFWREPHQSKNRCHAWRWDENSQEYDPLVTLGLYILFYFLCIFSVCIFMSSKQHCLSGISIFKVLLLLLLWLFQS